MTWVDRIREAAYTPPSGTRFTWDYEDVSRSFNKKTSAFEFPDFEGTYVQDLGRTGRRYPMRVFLWGADYDLQASAFEDALSEVGVGRLEHPMYGVVDVTPFGSVTRNDRLKTAANQAVLEFTLFETSGIVNPQASVDSVSSIRSLISDYTQSAANEFELNTDLNTAVSRSIFKGNYNSILNITTSTLRAIADSEDAVRQRFNAIDTSINSSIDLLIGDPITLALNTIQLVSLPSRATSSIQDRLESYGSLISLIVNSSGDGTQNNTARTQDLYVNSYVSAAVESALNTTYTTKSEAINAVDQLINMFDSVVAWRDNLFLNLDETDTGETYQIIQDIVALSTAYIVDLSFSLQQERVIFTDRNRNMIELSAELYGVTDSRLDFFMNSNNLTGSEILEIPKGREIRYYV